MLRPAQPRQRLHLLAVVVLLLAVTFLHLHSPPLVAADGTTPKKNKKHRAHRRPAKQNGGDDKRKRFVSCTHRGPFRCYTSPREKAPTSIHFSPRHGVFTHVPKTGGTSFMLDTMLGCYNFCLPAIRYREACANIFTKWLKTPLPPDGGPIVQMTILREPRAHVLSQYFQVATAGDAKFRKFEEEYNELRQENHLPTFPYPPQQASEGGIDKYDTFELWLDMFLDSPTNPTQPNQTLSNREASLVDYTPINMQAFTMVCNATDLSKGRPFENHFQTQDMVQQLWFANFDATVQQAREKLLSMTWVGLTEYYQQSICLLHHILFNRLSVRFCDCRKKISWQSFKPSTTGHGTMVHSVHELSEQVVKKIDVLTRADAILYEEFKQRLLSDIAMLESLYNTTLLC